MPTDTPKTDAEVFFAEVKLNQTASVVDADFARELERENARLRRTLKYIRDNAKSLTKDAMGWAASEALVSVSNAASETRRGQTPEPKDGL